MKSWLRILLKSMFMPEILLIGLGFRLRSLSLRRSLGRWLSMACLYQGGLVWLMMIRLLILMRRFQCSKKILSLTSLWLMRLSLVLRVCLMRKLILLCRFMVISRGGVRLMSWRRSIITLGLACMRLLMLVWSIWLWEFLGMLRAGLFPDYFPFKMRYNISVKVHTSLIWGGLRTVSCRLVFPFVWNTRLSCGSSFKIFFSTLHCAAFVVD